MKKIEPSAFCFLLSALTKRLCLLFSAFCFLLSVSAAPSGYRIRYVNAEEGTYGGDGLSWATAKNNIQNAIEELNAEVSANPSLRGLVFVAGADRAEGMKYVPTMRSTSDADGSVFNTSFRVYAGIYVYGGFAGNETPDDPDHPELLPNKRIMTNGHTYERVSSDIDADNLGQTVRRWNFKYKTVLSGNHSTSPIQFTYDTYRNIYSTSFPLSSYHVVWFATNGKVEDLAGGLVAGETDLTGHYQALRDTALVDGCTIEGGYASNTNLHGHNHAGYGGGAYMVKNSVLRNCIVHHCAATMRGGAVYMDGGGMVERCYIHTSQTTGYGMQQGYGGAVCIDYNGSLRHSYIIQSAARIGAGLAICHVPNEYPEATVYPDPEDRSGEYDPYALSTVIANCTSNAEGAGVYLDEGGTLNHCSVVNNKCVGPDVIYYGRRHGRTGGIYVRNGGTIYNTVAWGNESAVNNNVQYASFKDPTTTKKIEVYHSAFSKMDLTDWSSTSREVIVSLANNNFPTAEFHEGNYPMFNQPTTAAGIQYDPDSKTVDPDATADGEPYQRVYNWHPLSASALRMKAVQVTDALQGVADAVIHAHTDVDVVGRAFEPVSSIGALARSFRSLQWALEPSFEPGESQKIPTIFMDPNRVVYGASNTETSCGYLETEPAGNSWTYPCGNLADAITFFKNALVEGGADGETYYLLNGVHYPHVQILVKQGTLTVAGKGAYISGHARTASIRPGSNMRLYGGFAKELDGTDISKRSPHHYRTSLTADVIFGGYQDHSVHVIAIANQHDVIIDGFHLYSGNANIVKKDFTITDGGKTYELLADGAGVLVNNAMSADDKRIDMTGNILRNSVIANCSAPEGAAVYVSGGYKYKDGTRYCRAELTIVNTIIRNNTAGDAYGDPDRFVEGPDGVDSDAGIVTSNGNAHVWLRNCDIMNNCGYALKSLKPDEEAATDPLTNPRGYIEIYNSIIFSNGQRISADRSNISKAVSCKWTDDNTISGNYIYLDHDAVKPAMPPFIKCFNYLTRVKSEDSTMGFCYNSETGLVDKPAKLFYPLFANPSRNVGHSEGEDFPMYGGKVNYEPLPTNPIVNGAYASNMDSGNGIFASPSDEFSESNVLVKSVSMAYDRELNARTYGGDPDAGAIECTRLPKGGSVLYVTPDGAGRRDGSSWGNAIQGNAIYALDEGYGPDGSDLFDTTNGTTRIINTSGDGSATTGAADGVLTTDSRYCGFATAFITSMKTGATATTTVSDVSTTITRQYVGGPSNGESIADDPTSPATETETSVTNPGSVTPGFTAGWYDDDRYPYGELSGASRFFWRANQSPIPDWWTKSSFKAADSQNNPYTGETVTGIGDGTYKALLSAKDASGNRLFRVTNTRAEHYVGGLQYAVDIAAAYNAPGSTMPRREGIDSIQVWVSNGKFTDYKGFVMRDNTTVMGGFPAAEGGTPGLDERFALLSNVVDIPKAEASQNLESAKYETILQISDTNPEQSKTELNPEAVKAWDDDLAKTETTNTTTKQTVERSVTETYTWNDKEEKTSDYVLYPDCYYDANGVKGVFSSNKNRQRLGYKGNTYWLVETDGPQYNYGSDGVMGKSYFGAGYPDGQKIVYAYFGKSDGTNWETHWNSDDYNKSWEITYPDRGEHNLNFNSYGFDNVRDVVDAEGNVIGTTQYGLELKGALYGTHLWQTMKEVPAGDYVLEIDLAAYYQSNDNPSGVTFHIFDSQGTKVVTEAITYKSATTPRKLKRYTFEFTQASQGDLSILLDMDYADTDGTVANNDNVPNTVAKRDVLMDNVHLYKKFDSPAYVLTGTATSDAVTSTEPPVVTTESSYTVTKHRLTLRKRVLQMPDVSNPVFGGGRPMDYVWMDNGVSKYWIENIGGNTGGDNYAHCERVNLASRTSNGDKNRRVEDPDYQGYTDVIWDGFTIRHGFLTDMNMAHGGGAGVCMFEGAHLRNCIVVNNYAGADRIKGAGIFCDGSTATIEGCFVLNNTATRGTTGIVMNDMQMFAGGMFMYEGTCFNSLFANNYSKGPGGGMGFAVGKFYNNTIAYNTTDYRDSAAPVHVHNGGAISLATETNPNLLIANTVIYGNNSQALRVRYDKAASDDYNNMYKINPFVHCYIQAEVAFEKSVDSGGKGYGLYYKNIVNYEDDHTCYGVGNKFMNGEPPSAATTPFAADFDEDGNYVAGRAASLNDFRLTPNNPYLVNMGTEDFVDKVVEAIKLEGSGQTNRANNLYNLIKDTELPNTDVAFTDRVKDCQIDIGAYEYDGTISIEPMLFPDTKQAVFYVTQNGSGMATATDPANAACYLKFQKVLDAAGRWRYASYFYQNVENKEPGYTATNFTTNVLTHELELAQARAVAAGGTLDVATELTKLRDYQVVVKLEGDNGTHFSYIPTRTTRTTDNENPNDLEMSLIVPHGIQIEGGYEADFTADRDPLGRPTLFNGEINNTTLGNTGNVYHVVTFTNDLFNEYEHIYMDGDNQVHGQLAYLADADTYLSEGTDAEKTAWVNGNRAVLDGLFIENGFANGTTDEERRGAGAVVTDYAHIRNCVVQNNEAGGMGGGLYLEPAALVSGCIVKNNSAYIGGGIYVQDPVGSEPNAGTYVHVFSTTVVGNNAETTAGGLWFDMNLRANSSAFWMNRANDLNNIAGILNTDESQIADNYPLNYCGVESRRVNGVNNIELPVAESEGVRWDHLEPHEQEIHALSGGTDIVYYPITLSSVLGRSGMTYAAYEELRKVYPTLELTDIAGLKRMAHPAEDYITLATGATFTRVKKDNAFIEMGARVLNGSFELKVELAHIMTRLFVTTTEELPTEAALALQQNTVEKELEARGESFASGTPAYKAVENDVEMYKQMGSSFLNPFHRFGDALEYIIKVRKSTEDFVDADGNYRYDKLGAKMTVGDVYKDVRFEVYVGGGTFYPYRDAHGKQGEARSNTFVVPEEVTIVGGVNPLKADHHYCQERSGTKQVASYSFDCVETQQIRDGRTRMDRNGNHVMEPWEMEHQTILSGNAVNIDARTNVYHVITCFSDEDQVGKLPTRRNGSDVELPAMITGTPSTGERLQNLESESSSSRDLRTILIDGVTITGGHANDMEQTHVTDNFQKLTYFRGGGIFIDGNWDNSFDSKMDLPEVLSVARRDIPMIVANCLFQDNLAGNGGGVFTNGTFYAFSCHFTKNTARGPNTPTDQNYIAWTAGGAITNNYFVNVWNSLFDNNEAKRGDLPITVGTITNADARQGYGGAISCSETGLLRISNCDFVRNKAVAYPALYNFIDNNIRAYSGSLASTPEHRDYYGAGHHFAVNTIFWGNQATATTIAPANDIEAHYYTEHHRTLLPEGWQHDPSQDLRKPWHVANFGPLMDIATLTFCSLEEGTGREGTVWYDNHDYAKQAKIPDLTELYKGNFSDVLFQYFGFYQWDDDLQRNVPYTDGENTNRPKWPLTDDEKTNLLTNYTPYNYNLVLSSENTDENGPYFVQPSITAGADGYMETADWLVARLNPTIDTGWGFLKQKVTTKDIHTGELDTSFTTDEEATDAASESDNQYTDLYGEGFYNLHSENIHTRFRDLGFPDLLPIGDEKYMEYVSEGAIEGRNMRRISTHPKAGVQDVFIDMGIYEYQYVQLVTGGDEVDVIWVAETEAQGEKCDGSTWEKATSDLQNAIETLLLSLNNHDKVIKMRGGTYRPLKMTGGNQKTFFIATPSENDGVMTPAGLTVGDQTLVARSLSIYGGYTNEPLADYDDGELTRDPVANPVVFKMTREEGNTDHQLAHLFIIEDAEVKGNYVNYLTNRNKDFKDYTMPIVFDGLTFENPYGQSGTSEGESGGADIFYRTQYMTEQMGETFTKNEGKLLKAALDGGGNAVPKVIIRNCVFANSGSDEHCSAVKIQQGGGPALIANSLFHSNHGAPVEAVNTQVVNCTFALNGGHATITNLTENYADGSSASYSSGIHNSIIWKDDLAVSASERVQWDNTHLNLSAGNMTYNAYTQWNQSTGQWIEPNGNTTTDAQGNILLSSVNTDVLLGPNFIDPHESITAIDEDERENEILARDFRINPSAHIINGANVETYRSKVPYHAYYPDYTFNDPISIYNATTNPLGKDEEGSTQYARRRAVRDDEGNVISYYWFHSAQHEAPTTLTNAQLSGTDAKYQERDLAFKYRLSGNGLERGAYECTAAIERVLYVMDGASGNENGTSWENAFTIDEMQKAIDVASVYSLTSPLHERAYVFVKATDAVPAEPLHLREGVSIYGSIGLAFADTVRKVDNRHRDDELLPYINKVKAIRPGVVTRGTTHNTIRGICADNDATHTLGFLIDGFWFSADNCTTTPIDMVKENTVVRNAVITANTVSSAGVPVVNVAKGLLYNTLLYNNAAGTGAPMVSVGSNGYVLNCTLVPAPGQTALGGETGTEHVQNSIDATTSQTMFAPYFRPVAQGGCTGLTSSLPDYLTTHQPYWYQLHEASRHIDLGTDDGTTPHTGGNTIAAAFSNFVDFDHDRDLLGNPRRLRGRVDDGCFETWRITNAHYADNITTTTGTDAYADNYGGHRYPHAGSVVYLDEDASLVLSLGAEDEPLFTAGNPLQPGYVLLKDGASLYGQGNTLQLPYVAAEKNATASLQYMLAALPFLQRPQDVFSTSYNGSTDALAETPLAHTAYTYNGYKRSRYHIDQDFRIPGSDFYFHEANSGCWNLIADNNQLQPCTGWLLQFTSPLADATPVRYTGWGDADGTWAYQEDGSNKTVTLQQYNTNRVELSGYPHFTRAEDMGWNLKGQPWIVSNYQTGGTNPDFQMNVPHVVYSMNPDGTYIKAPGQVYTAQTWTAEASLDLTEGFFTQTAILGSEETLTFQLPTVPAGTEPEEPARPLLALRCLSQNESMSNDIAGQSDYQCADYLELHPSADAAAGMTYRVGSDGIKWFSFNETNAPQLYALNADGTPFSLLSAAPVETEIPLGIHLQHAPADAEAELEFSLPAPDAFRQYAHVWLTDHVTGSVTDLLRGNYAVSAVDDSENRFTLRIGGMAQDLNTSHQPSIGINRLQLVVRGLAPGDHVSVHSLSGMLIDSFQVQALNAKAAEQNCTEFRRLLSPGVYIVRVNNMTKKVHARR